MESKLLESFKALMRENFPEYDITTRFFDDQLFINDHVDHMWLMYQICNEWLPIESAPKDGTRIMLNMAKLGLQFGKWEAQKYNTKPTPYWTCDKERSLGIGWMRKNQPTHWRPLPIPPLTTEGGV